MPIITDITLDELLLRKFAVPAYGWPMVTTSFSDFLAALITWHKAMFAPVMRMAKTFHFRWLSTYRTLQLWPSTGTAKISRVFLGNVVLNRTRFAALLAFLRKLTLLPFHRIIMLNASAQSEMRAGAALDCAKPSRSMNQIVLGVVRTQLKILNAIVVTHFVSMMNHFYPRKVSSEMRLHDKPVFRHISSLTASRMVWALHDNIAIWGISLFTRFQIWPSLHGGTL